MDFRFSDDAEAFRAEVRAFLAEAMGDAPAHGDPLDLTGLDETFERELHRRAGARGWLRLDGEKRAVFEYEVAGADAPLIDTAVTLAGAVVAAHRPELLAAMEAGDVEACIAYTEAPAGSDLSAIEMVAVPAEDGDGWVLSGRKVLVTGAHKADWCVTIARTREDAPPREGMTMFLVDMRSEGVSVERRTTMNGWTLGDIGFDGVRVGPDAVLGGVHDGWRQLLAAVSGERVTMFWLGFARRVFELLVEHVRSSDPDGDAIARDEVARLSVELEAVERLARRVLWDPQAPAAGSMLKVASTELLQDLARTAVELAGPAGLVWAPLFGERPLGAVAGGRFAFEYLERVHGTISVGTNEVQRDAIAQIALGLPRRSR